MPSNDPS